MFPAVRIVGAMRQPTPKYWHVNSELFSLSRSLFSSCNEEILDFYVQVRAISFDVASSGFLKFMPSDSVSLDA